MINNGGVFKKDVLPFAMVQYLSAVSEITVRYVDSYSADILNVDARAWSKGDRRLPV